MSILSLLSGILFTVYLIIGFHVLSLDKKSITHRLFFICCIILVFIGIDNFFMLHTQKKDLFLLGFKLGMLSLNLFFPLLVHFSLYLTSYIKKIKFFVFLLYVPALPFIIKFLLGDLVVYKDILMEDGMWIFIPDYGSLWFYLFMTYLFICHLIIVFIMIMWGIKSRKRRIKRQALIVSISLLFFPVVGTIENMILPLITRYKSIGIGPLYYIVFAIGVWFSFVKYRFLTVTPELVSKDIASNIDESIILLNEHLQILSINTKTEALIDKKSENIVGKEFSAIFSQHERLQSEIQEMLKGNISDFSCRVDYKKADNTSILMDTKFSVVKDRFNDMLGILVLGREVKELKQLKTVYRLTYREVDIIQCIINGLANKEIGDFLEIAERTVKAHLTNIYNKLGVGNKVQLFSLLKDFNIISKYKASKVVLVKSNQIAL